MFFVKLYLNNILKLVCYIGNQMFWMKCANDFLGVKIANLNLSLDLSIKLDTGYNQIVDILFLLF